MVKIDLGQNCFSGVFFEKEITMTHKERLDKLTRAMDLVREVEFSYELGDPRRKMLYKGVVESWGFSGSFTNAMEWIKRDVKLAETETSNKDLVDPE